MEHRDRAVDIRRNVPGNCGCVPSKMFVYAADVAELGGQSRDRPKYGVTTGSNRGLAVDGAARRVASSIASRGLRLIQLAARNGLYEGNATFVGGANDETTRATAGHRIALYGARSCSSPTFMASTKSRITRATPS